MLVEVGPFASLESEAPGNFLYSQVAESLREQIWSGHLAAGDQLPGEAELASRLDVSRSTLRGALRLLQEEGLISKQRGARSIVSPARVQQTFAELETLDEAFAAQGIASTTRIIQYRFRQPSRHVASQLKLRPDTEILFVRRVHCVDDRPIAVADLGVSIDLAADLTRRDVEQRPFYDLIRNHLGIRLGRATQTIHAESASEDIAKALNVDQGAPILVCERLTLSDESLPLVHAVFRYRGDRFEFKGEVSAYRRTVSWAFPGPIQRPETSGMFTEGVSA